jgi:sugar transferase (PEP-CTERM system associated)
MIELFRSPRRAIVWFVEASLLALLAVTATAAMVGWAHALGGGPVLRAVLVATVVQGSMYYHGLYGQKPLRSSALVMGVLRALLFAAGVLAILYAFVLPHEARGPRIFLTALSAAALVLPTWRAAFERVARSPLLKSTAILLGGGPLARECASLLEGDLGSGVRLAGALVQEGEGAPPGLVVLGRYADVATVTARAGAVRIVVASSERRGALPVAALLDLKLQGVEIERAIDLYERITGRVYIAGLLPSDLVFARDFRIRRHERIAKRAFDLVASTVGLILAAPIVALSAVAIKVDSPGPVLYSQERVGEHGRVFRIRKLRSMRLDAEAGGAAWASENDPRVTRVGRFLRRSRVDEIPQLWNVLVGDMSLVGPRPERPEFVADLEQRIPFFRQRLSVKPGITGHAQVRSRYGASVEDAREKLQYDLFYIKRFSLLFDLSILVDTVKVVLCRIGSR